MGTNDVSTRRRFLRVAGATLAAPAAAVAGVPAAQRPGDDARLAALEAVEAIRTLQREYARLVNAGAHAQAARLFVTPAAAAIDETVRRLAADRFAAHERIELAQGGQAATARFECTVETATPIAGRYTLVDMLRDQGEGALRTVGRRVLDSAYVKTDGAWKIARLELRPA
jgi:hypothetical protein